MSEKTNMSIYVLGNQRALGSGKKRLNRKMLISSSMFWVTRYHTGTLGNRGDRQCQTMRISMYMFRVIR